MWRFLMHTGILSSARLAGLVGLMIILIPMASAVGQSIQTLRGRVVDSISGAPVTHARVFIDGTSYRTEANDDGRFGFVSLPPGNYRIVVQAPGFLEAEIPRTVVFDDVPAGIYVRLQPDPYVIDPIHVFEVKDKIAWDNRTDLSKQEIEKRRPGSLAELLQSVEGVQVNHTGGANGPALVSIRGSSPEHVLVLVDGQRAGSAGTGLTDLNSIPVEIVERVEVHRGGGSARYGADALAGVINIVTYPQAAVSQMAVESKSTTGRWGHRKLDASLTDAIPIGGLASRVSLSTGRSDGGFEYDYSVQPTNRTYSGKRLNNVSETQNYFLSARCDVSAKSQLVLSSQWYDNAGGLPGPASAPTPAARMSDQRKMLNLAWQRTLTRRLALETAGGLSRYRQSFLDSENPSPLNRFNSEYKTDRVSLESNLIGEFDFVRLQLGAQFDRDAFNHVDRMRPTYSMGQTRRTSAGAYVTLARGFDISWSRVFDLVSLDAAGRLDHAHTAKDSTSFLDITRSSDATQYSPKVGFALSRSGTVSYVIQTSYGKSFRSPPINALFWQGDAYTRGNPGLRPERSEHSEAGAEVAITRGMLSLRISSTYFHRYVSDLIVWAQGQGGAWQPYNLAAARLTGHEDAITLGAFNRALELRYTNTVTTGRNRVPGHVSHDKELTFTPHYIQNLAARLDIRFVFADLGVRSVGRRYALVSNQKYFDAYSVIDAGIGGRVSLSRLWRVEATYDVGNVSNEDYVLIAHYPMPGREWTFGLKVEFGPGR